MPCSESIITASVRKASAAKIGAIGKFSALYNAQQIHDVVVEYHGHTLDIITKTDALSSFKSRGREEYCMTRTFIGKLLLAQCTTEKLRDIGAAFSSVSATKTNQLYYLCSKGYFEKEDDEGNDFSGQKIQAIQNTADRFAASMQDMSNNVEDALCNETFTIADFEGGDDDMESTLHRRRSMRSTRLL